MSSPCQCWVMRMYNWYVSMSEIGRNWPTWWLIPLSKWVITPVISGLTLLIPFITGVIAHLLSGTSHQVAQQAALVQPGLSPGKMWCESLEGDIRSATTFQTLHSYRFTHCYHFLIPIGSMYGILMPTFGVY